MTGTRAQVARRGRPPKGGIRRSTLIAKLPAEHASALIREADEAGLPITDYLAMLICDQRGWPVPEYIATAVLQHEAGPEPTLDLGLAS